MSTQNIKTKLLRTLTGITSQNHTETSDRLRSIIENDINSWEDLVREYETSDKDTRLLLIKIYERAGYKGYSQVLLKSFLKDDEDFDVRKASGAALGFLRSKRALKPIVNALRSHPDVVIREISAYALGWLMDARAIDVLLATLNSPTEDNSVRARAAESLGIVTDTRSVLSLVSALRDTSPEVRFWSAYALGQIGDRSAIPELEYLAEHDHTVVNNWWEISKEAKDAIMQISSNS